MREINEIIIHCADTKTNQSFTIDDIREWHLARGFSDVGYHYVIDLAGAVWYGRPLEQYGAHCKGKNIKSIGICFMGGLNPDGSKWDSPTEEQIEQFRLLKYELFTKFGKLKVSPHSNYSSKSCPNFDIDIL
jgi:N-acetylmuramoyl-L-alanine amidase